MTLLITLFCYFQQLFLHLGYTGEADRLVLDIARSVDNQVSGYTIDAESLAQVFPLFSGEVEMLAMNVGNHILPSALGRCLAGDVDVNNVLVLQRFLHGHHFLVGHAARSAPGSPEVHQDRLSAELADDGCKEVFVGPVM